MTNQSSAITNQSFAVATRRSAPQSWPLESLESIDHPHGHSSARGAESLAGKGDAFLRTAKGLRRVQCAMV